MATNFVKASFQEIYDLHTTTNTSTILGVHTPISTRVHQYLHGFFQQYKQFKYDGCSLVFIPVSQLPVDPLQVGTEAGYVDPRDLVNPIVHCGIHGESLGNTLEKLFNLSVGKSVYDGLDVLSAENIDTEGTEAGYLESMYYTALASPSFQKAHVQRGFRKSHLVPLAYQMQTNRQLMPFYDGGTDYVTVSPNTRLSTEPWGPADNRPEDSADMMITPPGTNVAFPFANGTAPSASMSQVRLASGTGVASMKDSAQVFSGNLRRLGWLDTLQTSTSVYTQSEVEYHDGGSRWTALPKLYMYLVMMPPCYMQK